MNSIIAAAIARILCCEGVPIRRTVLLGQRCTANHSVSSRVVLGRRGLLSKVGAVAGDPGRRRPGGASLAGTGALARTNLAAVIPKSSSELPVEKGDFRCLRNRVASTETLRPR